MSRTSVVMFIVVCVAGFANAHPDYERTVTSIVDDDGQQLNIVLHYTDGIVATDPVKLIIYGTDGTSVAETPYFRDITVHSLSDGKLWVFALHPRHWNLSCTPGRLPPVVRNEMIEKHIATAGSVSTP